MTTDFARAIPVLASLPGNTSCYIRGGQVAALHEEYLARGVPNLSPFLV